MFKMTKKKKETLCNIVEDSEIEFVRSASTAQWRHEWAETESTEKTKKQNTGGQRKTGGADDCKDSV